MCRCLYVHVKSSCGGICCCCSCVVVVDLAHRWACLFWCGGFLLLSISQGPQGDIGGGHGDWAMQSWASHSYRSTADTSFWRPSVSSLSAHSSAWQQTWQQAGCSLFVLVSSFRAGDCRAGAYVATRAKWTFLHHFLSKALCWHNNLPPKRTYYVWIFNIYMTMTWFIGAVMCGFSLQVCKVCALTCTRWRTPIL